MAHRKQHLSANGLKRDGNAPCLLLAESDNQDAFWVEMACFRSDRSVRVRRVCGGQEVIDYLAGHGRYDDRSRYSVPMLVLLDWKLPVSGGAAVLRWVRAHPLLKRLGVVVLSDLADEATNKQAFELRANSVIKKPRTFWECQEIVDSLLRFWGFNEIPTCNGSAVTDSFFEKARTFSKFRGMVKTPVRFWSLQQVPACISAMNPP